MDVVDQSVYLRDVRKTHVDHFTKYSEGSFLCLHPPRQNRVKMLQNFGDGDINICVDSAHPNRAVRARQPTGYCDRQMPRLTLRNRWWRRHFFRLQFDRTCCQTADGCEKRPCEERQFYSHGSILWWLKLKSKKIICSSAARFHMFCFDLSSLS